MILMRLGVAGVLVLAALPASAKPREIRGASAGAFDFYVLALSWSPGFCEAGGSARGRSQCEAGRQLGFVMHGLWPQFEQGYPSFCEPGGRIPLRTVIEEARGLFPDEGMVRYQWRKHGTCSGLSPLGYVRAAARARTLVRTPDRLERPEQDMKVLAHEIERAFAEVNPGLRPEMMAVECGRQVFQEIRICLTKDLRGFRTCPEVDRAGCRAGEITVNGVQ